MICKFLLFKVLNVNDDNANQFHNNNEFCFRRFISKGLNLTLIMQTLFV